MMLELGRRLRVVIDTNCFVSMLLGKRLASLKVLLLSPEVEVCYSQTSLNELLSVVSRKKFEHTIGVEQISRLMRLVRLRCTFINVPDDNMVALCRDPKDNYLLSLAVCADADFLLTGDKDLLEIGRINNCRIIRSAEFDTICGNDGK